MTEKTKKGLPECLKGMVCSLKKCSEGNGAYMTESQISVIYFDQFSPYYCKNTGVKILPASNDALYKTAGGKWIFIEFKNGQVRIRDLQKKIYDSLVMLVETEIFKNYAYSREHAEYILVYNKEAAVKDTGMKEKTQSESDIHNHLSQKANGTCLFGLERFKGYLFSDVHAYTQEEFEENFVKVYEDEECRT